MDRISKMKIKRGLKADIPTLDTGELGLTIDEGKVYVGTPIGNKGIVSDDQLNETDERLTAQLAQTNKQQQLTPIVDVYESKMSVFRSVVIHDGDDNLYAIYSRTGATRTLEKSTDKGNTWVTLGDIPSSYKAIYKVHATGTLILIEESGLTTLRPARMFRSVNDGASWELINQELNFAPLSSQGICETPSGYIVVGEYGNIGNHSYRILRSVDDGITWTVVLSSSGTDPAGDPGHIHSVTYDPYENKLVAFMDRPTRGNDGPLIYTSSNEGATWDLLGVSYSSTTPNFVSPMYFKTHIAWGSDNQRNGVISRIKRTDFYSGKFDKVEDILKLNDKVYYFTFPLRPDVWLVSMATETVSASTVPDGPGSYMQEHFLVSDNGSVVSGGFSSFSLRSQIGTLAGLRSEYPSYKFNRLDHKGFTFANIITGNPAFYAATPISQGFGLPTQKLNGLNSNSVLNNYQPLRSLDKSGTPTSMLWLDDLDRVVLKNEKAGSTSSELRFHPNGEAFLIKSGTSLAYTSGENFIIPKMKLASNGVGFYAGPNDPNGKIDATPGSLYLNWNGGRGISLWTKISGSGNTGWEPVGAASGPTNNRPTITYTGMQYFDTNLNKPLYRNHNNTDWLVGIVRAEVPSSPTSAGRPGDIAFDANFIYVCWAVDKWNRIAKDSTWV